MELLAGGIRNRYAACRCVGDGISLTIFQSCSTMKLTWDSAKVGITGLNASGARKRYTTHHAGRGAATAAEQRSSVQIMPYMLNPANTRLWRRACTLYSRVRQVDVARSGGEPARVRAPGRPASASPSVRPSIGYFQQSGGRLSGVISPRLWKEICTAGGR